MESPPPPARFISPKSKKRVFPGSSSSYMDADVVEIPPPLSWNSKSKSVKQKEAIHVEIIDIDMDEDSADVMLIDEKLNRSNKGKEALVDLSYGYSNSAKPLSVDGIQASKKSSLCGPNDPSNLEGFSNDFSYGDEFMDLYHDDLTCDDDYTFLQAHFDNIDIPPGVEAPIPWFSDTFLKEKDTATVSSSKDSSFPIQVDGPATDLSHSLGMPKVMQMGKRSTSRGVSMQTHLDSEGVHLSSPLLFSESASNKKKLAASLSPTHLMSQTEKAGKNHRPGSESWCIPGFSHVKKKHAVSGSTSDHASQKQPDAVELQSLMDPSFRGPSVLRRRKKYRNGNQTSSRFSSMETPNFPSGAEAFMSGWQTSVFIDNPSFMGDGMYSSSDATHLFSKNEVYIPHVQGPGDNQNNASASASSTAAFGSTTSIQNTANVEDIMRRFQHFKQFDTVQDHSDHHYSWKGSSASQPSKNWAKKIQEEWRILERDLPDTIFVRVYESRMDLLRAVIVGAEGTPYHDGLFFFDVFFPPGYPNVPPHVYYHSGGLRINPNLYNSGKVCLSLLNTWSGNKNEKWIPGRSTMLQVLVSIQALILNAKPYFNEPGYASMSGSANGEKNSLQYNENTFILSLKTMMYAIKRPPKHFEDLVVGHFCKHAQDILVACKAYMEGVQVGCLVKGGVQDVDAGDKSCSQNFKDSLASIINILVQAFTQIGAKDCDKFLALAAKASGQQQQLPMPSNYQYSLVNPQTAVMYP
ncbi:Ubiquitin--protein ligase [Bertholletia excelsa]